MRQRLAITVALVVVAAVLTSSWTPARTTAQGQKNGADDKQAKPPGLRLPITQVVLYSSGVGFFLREGEVEGNARVNLSFPASDVNDLLKSLVVHDSGGGKIGAISYDSHDPVERTLRSFALDLTANPSLGQILNQARGEKVEVTLQQAGAAPPAPLVGQIVGMESQAQTQLLQQKPGEAEFLNLRCNDGLHSVSLAQIQKVRFLNQAIDAEFQKALDTLAATHDSERKTVGINLVGEGKRTVRIGYVVESPIWKTSYRLTLDKNGKSQLQGWAIVENTGEEDWNGVRMVLVAGRPMSYQMNLYAPLYVPRPTVEPERFASLRPPAYNAALATPGKPGEQGQAPDLQQQLQAPGQFQGGGQFGGFAGFPGFNFQGFGGQGYTPYNRYQFFGQQGGQAGWAPPPRLTYEELQKRRQQAMQPNPAEGNQPLTAAQGPAAAAAASAEEVGEVCEYAIDQKVTVPRQKSAMLPIVNQPIDSSRVSIFNANVHPRLPLTGLRCKNTTGQRLVQGPLTVFDGGPYAGDARIMDLQPNEERLLSFAIDLGTEVKASDRLAPCPEWTVRLENDTVVATYQMRRTRTYLMKNRSEQERNLVIEHPISPNWKLITQDKLLERTRNVYRFEVKVAAGQSATFDVIEEQPDVQSIAFTPAADSRRREAAHAQSVFQPVRQSDPEELVAVKIVKGTLHTTYKDRDKLTYHVTNRSDQERKYVLEHLVRAGWKLADGEKPVEGSGNWHKFSLTVAPGKTGSRDVHEERLRTTTIALAGTSPERLLPLSQSAVASQAVKDALKKVLDVQARLTETQKELDKVQKQLDSITTDQARLRANLREVPPNSAAYKRYLEKFDTQETEVEKLQDKLKSLQDTAKQQRKEQDDLGARTTAE